MGTPAMYQWRAELEDYRPVIWRRFQTPGNITVAQLAYTVMAMYKMEGNHLFSVEHKCPMRTPSGKLSRKTALVGRYNIPAMDMWDEGDEDATTTKLSALDLKSPSYLILWYDFGDDWRVKIKLEKTFDALVVPDKELPRILEGAGFGIIEDCGGPFALEDLVDAFKEKKGERYANYREWLNRDDLDLETFDITDINCRLKKLMGGLEVIYG